MITSDHNLANERYKAALVTICTAGLCVEDGRQLAVVAADRMVTYGGFIEFEHSVPKMAHPSQSAIVMIAGDTFVGTRLAQTVVDLLPGTSPRIADIAQQLAQHYEAVRMEKVEHQILAPRRLNLQTFYGAHASLNGQITMMLDQAMANFNLGVELLLAGVDELGARSSRHHRMDSPRPEA
jgi:hypothetical protein